MNCELCNEDFQESINGLVVLTFHRLMRHTDLEINGYEPKNEFGEDWVEY